MAGKGMRTCCDSLAQSYADHIKGCKHYMVRKNAHFIRMDNSRDTIKLDGGLFNWLTERKLRLSENVSTGGGLADVQTIYECDGTRVGIVMNVEYAEAA